jgi:hypothetical protein
MQDATLQGRDYQRGTLAGFEMRQYVLLKLPKTHWLDAAVIGASTPSKLHIRHVVPWLITAEGRQRRQMVLMDKRGFPRSRAKQRSCVRGFRTGDIARVRVPSGKKRGSYVGRVAVRASCSFNITTRKATIQGVAARFCTQLHHADGYSYQKGERCFLPIP